MRVATLLARWLVLVALVAAAPALSACNTLRGAGKDIQKIGEGVETGVDAVEEEVTN
jgi:predicted small secreted protein